MLAILATEQIEETHDMIKTGEMKTSWEQMNRDMITNDAIQNIKVLAGEHYLHHDQADQIAKLSKEFISEYVRPADHNTGRTRPVPKTGDSADPVLWIGLVLLGIWGISRAMKVRKEQ